MGILVGVIFALAIAVVSVIVAFFSVGTAAITYSVVAYGVWAFLAVLKLVTKPPRDIPGQTFGSSFYLSLPPAEIDAFREFFTHIIAPDAADIFSNLLNTLRLIGFIWAGVCFWQGFWWVGLSLILFWFVPGGLIVRFAPLHYMPPAAARGNASAIESLALIESVRNKLASGRPVKGSDGAPDLVGGVNTKWRPRPFHHNKSRDDEAEWFANAPGWSLVDSRLIAVLIDRLHGKSMFEVFVHASQDCDLIAKYAALSELFDRSVGDVAALPRVADILGTAGVENGAKFVAQVKSKSTSEKALGRLYENAINACEGIVNLRP